MELEITLKLKLQLNNSFDEDGKIVLDVAFSLDVDSNRLKGGSPKSRKTGEQIQAQVLAEIQAIENMVCEHLKETVLAQYPQAD